MKTREEIYKQKTLDAATNMILTKLEELRGDKAENKELKRRRWIWELIQNANDCSNGKPIDISIDTDDNAVVFSHNGSCFTYENLIDLITQISTKIKDEEKIGKFGTGFISTHLISEVVEIQGLYHKSEESKEYKKLNLILDRSGCTDRIAEGVTLEDGEIFADEISYVKENKQEVGIEIHSGRNRIVRRIFEFLGYTVTKLDRVYYAGLTKKNLKRGAWRFLTREEVERLKSGQYE